MYAKKVLFLSSLYTISIIGMQKKPTSMNYPENVQESINAYCANLSPFSQEIAQYQADKRLTQLLKNCPADKKFQVAALLKNLDSLQEGTKEVACCQCTQACMELGLAAGLIASANATAYGAGIVFLADGARRTWRAGSALLTHLFVRKYKND